MSITTPSSVRETRRLLDAQPAFTAAASFAWENVFEIVIKNAWIAVLAILLATGITVTTGVANAAPEVSNTISFDADTNSGFGSAIIGGGN